MNAIIDQQRERVELVARGIWAARLERARRLRYGAEWCSWERAPDMIRDAVREEARGALAVIDRINSQALTLR